MSPQENKRNPVLMLHQEQRDKDILFFSPAAVTITQMCLLCDLVFLLSFKKNKQKQTVTNKEKADIAMTAWLALNGEPV